MAFTLLLSSILILHCHATVSAKGIDLTPLDIFMGANDQIFPKEFQLQTKSQEGADFVRQLKNLLAQPKIGVQTVYANYLKAYGKDPNRANDGVHAQIFEDNLMTIAAHNIDAHQGQSSFTMGINPFTDMSQSEFLSSYTGHTPGQGQGNKTYDYLMNQEATAADPKDWRTSGDVTSVKNQKNCGSCVTFATVACVESQYSIQKKQKNMDLSEQEIVDCTRIGCGGGDWPDAFNYMINGGVSLDSVYPYTEKKGSCRATASNRQNGAKMASWAYVSQRSGGENTMKDYINKNGPIVLGVHVNSAFQNYKSGVFDATCNGGINHAVTGVGFGYDSTKKKNYWIVKNSWGTGWGEKGYIRVELGTNRCRISEDAAYCKI